MLSEVQVLLEVNLSTPLRFTGVGGRHGMLSQVFCASVWGDRWTDVRSHSPLMGGPASRCHSVGKAGWERGIGS